MNKGSDDESGAKAEDGVDKEEIGLEELDPDETEEGEGEAEEGEPEDPEAAEDGGEDDGPEELTLEDETPTDDKGGADNETIRRMRRELREKNARQSELERERDEARQRLRDLEDGGQETSLPEKPKASDFEYDTEGYAKALEEWHETKAAIDKRKADRELAESAATEEVKRKAREFEDGIATYTGDKAELQEAIDSVIATFSRDQVATILTHADNPHHVVHALGKYPERASELAGQRDLAAFTKKLIQLEGKITVTKGGKPKPKAESTPKGKTGGGGGGAKGNLDAQIAQAKKEMVKTGNGDKYIQLMRKKREGEKSG